MVAGVTGRLGELVLRGDKRNRQNVRDHAAPFFEAATPRRIVRLGLASMDIVQRHMLWRILLYFAAVCTSLTLAIMLLNTFGLFDLWRLGTLSTPNFLLTNLLTVAPIICQTGPISVTIAVVFVYHDWIRHSEIVVLRAAGRSLRSIALPGILAGMVALICTGASSLYLLGATFPTLAEIVFLSKVALPYGDLQQGVLNEIAPTAGLSFQHRHSANVLEDVTLLQWPEPGKLDVITAKTGTLAKTAKGDVLVLDDGTMQQQIGEQKEGPLSFDRMDILIRPVIGVEARGTGGYYEKHVAQLLAPPTNSSVDDELEYPHRVAEGHQRIITPLVCLNYVLLSLGVLLSGAAPRQGLTFRVVAIGVAVTALHISMVITHGIVAHHPILLPFFYLYAVIPGSIGAVLLSAETGWIRRGWRRLRLLTPARTATGRSWHGAEHAASPDGGTNIDTVLAEISSR